MKKVLGVILTSVFCLSLFTSCGVGPAVKVLKTYNDDASRYWIAFIKKNGINAINEDGYTLLLEAVEANDTELVKACIKSKADVNRTSKFKNFPIDIAVDHDKINIVALLLKAGAKPNPDEKIDTLGLAIHRQNLEVINLLIKAKANLDYSGYRNDERRIAVRFEGSHEYPITIETLELLHKNGYKPSLIDLISICQKFLETEDSVLENRYYQIIKEDIKLPVYQDKTLLNSEDTLVTSMYVPPISTFSGYQKAMNLVSEMQNNGYPFYTETANTSPNGLLYCFLNQLQYVRNKNYQDVPLITVEESFKIVDFLIDNELFQHQADGESFFLNEIVKFGNAYDYNKAFVADVMILYDYCISKGLDPAVTDSRGQSAATLMEELLSKTQPKEVKNEYIPIPDEKLTKINKSGVIQLGRNGVISEDISNEIVAFMTGKKDSLSQEASQALNRNGFKL